jgi:hypothetical protein
MVLYGLYVRVEDIFFNKDSTNSLSTREIPMLTVLISSNGISPSSSYSDSSSELVSSSEELVSVGVEGDLTVAKLAQSRRLLILSDTGRAPLLVPLYLLNEGFFSFGGRGFLVEMRAGVKVTKRG